MSIFEGLNSSNACGNRLLEDASFISVKPVIWGAATTLLRLNRGRITRSSVVDLPLPASPIRNRCGYLMPIERSISLTKHPVHHASTVTVFAGSL